MGGHSDREMDLWEGINKGSEGGGIGGIMKYFWVVGLERKTCNSSSFFLEMAIWVKGVAQLGSMDERLAGDERRILFRS